MSNSPVLRPVLQHARRFAADIIVGLALFVFIVSVATPNRSAAAPQTADIIALSATAGEATTEFVRDPAATAASVAAVAVPTLQSAGMGMFSQSNHRLALILLAAVCSAMVAFNLAFFRHLREVSAATPRSRRTAR